MANFKHNLVVILCCLGFHTVDSSYGSTFNDCVHSLYQTRLRDGRLTCEAVEAYTTCAVRALNVYHLPSLRDDVTSVLDNIYRQHHISCDIDVDEVVAKIRQISPPTQPPMIPPGAGSREMRQFYRCQDVFFQTVINEPDDSCPALKAFMKCTFDSFNVKINSYSQFRLLQAELDRVTGELGVDCDINLKEMLELSNRFEEDEKHEEARGFSSPVMGFLIAGFIMTLVVIYAFVRVYRHRRLASNYSRRRTVNVSHLVSGPISTSGIPPGVSYQPPANLPAKPPDYAALPPTYDEIFAEGQITNQPPSIPQNAPPSVQPSAPTSTPPNSPPSTGPNDAPHAYNGPMTYEYLEDVRT